MSKAKFHLNKLYNRDMLVLCEGVSDKKMNNLFKDGRVASLVAEEWLSSQFDLKRNPDNGGHFDLYNKTSRYETRTITKRGTSIAPSYMIGVGREYNWAEIEAKAKSIDGFIFVDVRNFPDVKFFGLDSEAVLGLCDNNGRITANKIDELTDFLQGE